MILKIVLLDSLIRLSESFLMMYRSGGRSRGPGGSISPEVPRISDLAGLTAAQRAIIGPLRSMRSRYEPCEGADRDLMGAPSIPVSLRETRVASVVAPRC